MTYNTLAFYIKDEEGLFSIDKTTFAHEWLDLHEKREDWKCNCFDTLDSAKKHARKAALYIAQRFDVSDVSYCIIGSEQKKTFGTEFKPSDFYQEYYMRIDVVEKEEE